MPSPFHGRRGFLLLLVLAIGTLCVLVHLSGHGLPLPPARSAVDAFASSRSTCLCSAPDGRQVNVCFSATNMSPGRRTIGHPFPCKHVAVLATLHLLDEDMSETKASSNPPIVTAVSNSHFGEALAMISSMQDHMNETSVIVYDLGLTAAHRASLARRCQVADVRTFPYPALAANLYTYQWKPLLIAKVLEEMPDGFFYMDTSARFKSPNLMGRPVIEKLVDDISSDVSSPLLLLLENMKPISTHAVTHPKMFEYLPMPMSSRLVPRQYGGGILFVLDRPATRSMLKWWVLCALTRECMTPKGAKLSCKFAPNDRVTKYANCHRYDQSAINIISSGYHDYNESTPYISATFAQVSKWMIVDRSARGQPPPRECSPSRRN